jgi:hypothetical protein
MLSGKQPPQDFDTMNKVKAQTANPSLHNKAMAVSFLTGFDPNDEIFDFQLSRGHQRSKIFHGPLEELWPAVEELNTLTHGVEVFVLPNGFAGRQPRALFAAAKTKEQVDSAKAAITAYDVKCDMIVRDVTQIILCYPCSDIPIDQYATAQRRLSTALGTDSTIVDLSRIRLPGTLCFDNPAKPQLVGLLRNGASKDWKLDDLLGRLGSQDKPSPSFVIPEALTDTLTLRLRLLENGFDPVIVSGKRPVMNEWQRLETTAESLREWTYDDQNSFATNTGSRTKNAPALDIDIMHQEAAEAVEALARQYFAPRGDIYVRIGLPPKRLIPLRTDAPFRKLKRTFATPIGVDGKPPKIEILGDGQQYVVAGIHPDTRKPYQWTNGAGDIDVRDIRRDVLPLVTAEDCEAFLADATKLLIEQFGFTEKQAKAGGGDGNGAAPIKIAPAFRHLNPIHHLNDGIEDHWFDLLTPEQKDEVVDYALKVIASKTPLLELEEAGGNNDQWYRLTAAVARSGAPNAEDIFIKYASIAKNADPEGALREYFAQCQKNPRGITVATLLWLAPEHGADFEPWRNCAAVQERRAKQIAENIKIGEDVTESLLPQIMTLKEMHERLVFVGSSGVVADITTKRVRKKEHALDEYAASQHSYTQKNAAGNEVIKIGPALKHWIASPKRITVEVLAWVPGAEVICEPPEGQGPAFNMWRGLSPMAYPENWQEWVQPFLEHVEYLVPIEHERERFLQWLAHIIQHPEVLPHTSYLMITPTTGIGRNLLASILVRALRGFVAAGVSLPVLLDKGFTGRLSQKLLIIVDEAREGRGERRYERAERFKQLQTEEHRDINHKYGYQVVEKNCGRWLEFSNHWDAIPFDNTDRRDIVIANPTTRKENAYYEWLYGLLGDKDFIGSVRHWLETKDISTFHPGEHAPLNQAKLQALNEMMSETERAVAEFKEECETELTSRNEIKDYVLKNNNNIPVNDTHLTYAIRRGEMVSTGRRIKAYKKHDNNYTAEKRFTVVIVRGEWTPEIIKKADPNKLLAAMGLGDWSTWKPQG